MEYFELIIIVLFFLFVFYAAYSGEAEEHGHKKAISNTWQFICTQAIPGIIKALGLLLIVGAISTGALFAIIKLVDYVWDGSDTDKTYKGYECTQDCSGHRAGYNWAEEKGITDPDDCGGNSQSFIEGCWSYAEEN